MWMIHCSAKSVALVGASRYAPTLPGVRIVGAVSRPPLARFQRHPSFRTILEGQLFRHQAPVDDGVPDADICDVCLAAAPQGMDDDDCARREDPAFLRLDISDAHLIDDAPQDDHPGPAAERPDDRGTHCSVCV